MNNQRHSNVIIGILSTMLLLLTTSAIGNPVDDYKQLVNQWLNLEAQQRHLHNDWHSQKPQLQQRIALLEHEKNLLKEKLDSNEKNQDSVVQKRAQQIERQETLEHQQRQLTLWLQTQLSHIYEELNILPPPLQATWQSALKNITKETSNSDKLATILGIYNKKNEFNARISSVKSKILLADNSTRLVDQIYFGTALGYYATPDGKQLGIGSPSTNGWEWQNSNDLDFPTFKQAQAMLEKQQSAELILLPIILRQPVNIRLTQTKREAFNNATEHDLQTPTIGGAR